MCVLHVCRVDCVCITYVPGGLCNICGRWTVCSAVWRYLPVTCAGQRPGGMPCTVQAALSRHGLIMSLADLQTSIIRWCQPSRPLTPIKPSSLVIFHRVELQCYFGQWTVLNGVWFCVAVSTPLSRKVGVNKRPLALYIQRLVATYTWQRWKSMTSSSTQESVVPHRNTS